ncbi:hypothetical protein GLOTRDRAFT_132489 [Gloeophyllum trabeum ATCC 11539]|uniref:F-box domain-containing protein n=1 Tax=Gloeophyllum trabeum (strain ATCC 11539 / FP-39264 / Madison 617) TaxID=670483 RepID=S7PYE9_GLOTA|nr:uncharacterized protein GLOTRDRAFT_132489 [Gloeophyllum trabeum ATCC 11539]EPQ52377.1 hypothetical protein GLOTRDRAFT_132489 [Gloeophyllum trabeum ATCC 11539]
MPSALSFTPLLVRLKIRGNAPIAPPRTWQAVKFLTLRALHDVDLSFCNTDLVGNFMRTICCPVLEQLHMSCAPRLKVTGVPFDNLATVRTIVLICNQHQGTNTMPDYTAANNRLNAQVPGRAPRFRAASLTSPSLTNTARDEFPLLTELLKMLLIGHGVVRQLCLVGGGAETEMFRDLDQYVQLKEGLPHDLDL